MENKFEQKMQARSRTRDLNKMAKGIKPSIMSYDKRSKAIAKAKKK